MADAHAAYWAGYGRGINLENLVTGDARENYEGNWIEGYIDGEYDLLYPPDQPLLLGNHTGAPSNAYDGQIICVFRYTAPNILNRDFIPFYVNDPEEVFFGIADDHWIWKGTWILYRG